jgi:hypothetical protein
MKGTPMIEIKSTGSFKKTEDFLGRMSKGELFRTLESYGAVGVNALAMATPVDSGLTANSWTYEIVKKLGKYSIIWHNTNIKTGIPVAILIQYGHATRNGGWIEGRDFINPAIRPIFDQIINDIWEKVRNG